MWLTYDSVLVRYYHNTVINFTPKLDDLKEQALIPMLKDLLVACGLADLGWAWLEGCFKLWVGWGRLQLCTGLQSATCMFLLGLGSRVSGMLFSCRPPEHESSLTSSQEHLWPVLRSRPLTFRWLKQAWCLQSGEIASSYSGRGRGATVFWTINETLVDS